VGCLGLGPSLDWTEVFQPLRFVGLSGWEARGH